MSIRGLLTALVVVLAAVLVLWLTGDDGPGKASKPTDAAEAREVDDGKDPQVAPAGKSSGKESETKERVPTWKRAMPRPRSAEGEEPGPNKQAADQMPKTPHSDGPPQR